MRQLILLPFCSIPSLPFWLFDLVPEPGTLLPQASLLQFPHGGGLLGVLAGGNSERW